MYALDAISSPQALASSFSRAIADSSSQALPGSPASVISEVIGGDGVISDIEGITAYLSYPPNLSTTYAICYLMDEFGIGFKGHTLYIDARGSVCARNGADFDYRLADRLAQAGYFVVIPNLAEGDAGKVPLEVDPELASWSRTHIDDGVYPGIKIILKAMRTALGVEKIGAMGFSDSARSVVRFLAEGKGVDAGFIVMPSFATILPTEVAAIARPLSIADSVPDYSKVPIDTFDFEGLKERLAAEATLQRLGATFQVILYSDSVPGFYVNDNEGDRKQGFAKDSVFRQAVQWFDEWLKNDLYSGPFLMLEWTIHLSRSILDQTIDSPTEISTP